MHLEENQPEDGVVLSESPREIRLGFSEEPQDAILDRGGSHRGAPRTT